MVSIKLFFYFQSFGVFLSATTISFHPGMTASFLMSSLGAKMLVTTIHRSYNVDGSGLANGTTSARSS